MNEQRDREINTLLDHIYPQDDTELPHEEQPPRRINVYIEVEEEEIPAAVESTVDEPADTAMSNEPRAPISTEPQHSGLPGQPLRRRRTQTMLLVLFLFSLVGLLVGLGYAIILPMLTPSATITVVTASSQQTVTSTIQVVNGAADPTKHQVTGRGLASVTMSQARTVPTTGTAHQDARAGHGIITFYNGAISTQTIPAGTVLPGADGTQLVTDTDATIPAAVFPTFGQTTVYAHAAMVGPGGNVRAGDVYGSCCRLNVSAVNGAFTGGQDARTYQTVTPQDITGVVTSVKTSLEQSVQAALQTQVHPAETLISPLPCMRKVTADHQPGEEAAQVSVTIDETCTGTVYNTQAFASFTTQIATQDAQRRLGTDYRTTGVHTSIIQATPKEHGSIDLQVKSVSVWAYEYGPEQQQAIKTMIAGMSKDKAKTTLLHLAGVQSVSLTTRNGTTLPTDAENIHLLCVQLG